jgi:hypothetical protein
MIAMTTNSSMSVKAFRAARLSRAELPLAWIERPLLSVFIFLRFPPGSGLNLDSPMFASYHAYWSSLL